MEWFEAVILGMLQGLTEFLPVSSSGHLEIGKELLGVETSDDLLFTTMVQYPCRVPQSDMGSSQRFLYWT